MTEKAKGQRMQYEPEAIPPGGLVEMIVYN